MPARIRELRQNAWKEARIIALIFAIILLIFVNVDAFEIVMKLATTHENWQLDEFLTALVVLPIGLLVFSWRRLRETHAELRSRLVAERKASVLARYDPLTGLPTRRSAALAIRREMGSADTHPFAVIIFDLKRFRAVNSLHGDRMGDKVMVALSERLKAWAGQTNLVSRLVGDEFLVLLRETGMDERLSAKITRIAKDIEAPICISPEVKGIVVGASIGVTVVSDPALTSDQVLSQAFAALERAKASGGTSFAFFELGMDSSAQDRAQLEADLREAIADGEITPYFQPLVSLVTGKVVGYEALARWQRSDGTLYEPDLFIGVAEQTGQIENLFYAMLEKAARAAADWPANLYLAVNLSPLQFDSPWLVENTLRVLSKAGLPAGRLEVEITESALTSDFASASKIISEFRRQRIRVSLDDFGTGYSSLQHLAELKFDKIKIDRSFVQGLENNEGQRAIIRAIVTMAHALDLKVTVEGIDSLDYAATVRAFGCDQGQGYLFGRPRPDALACSDDLNLVTALRRPAKTARLSAIDLGRARAVP